MTLQAAASTSSQQPAAVPVSRFSSTAKLHPHTYTLRSRRGVIGSGRLATVGNTTLATYRDSIPCAQYFSPQPLDRRW